MFVGFSLVLIGDMLFETPVLLLLQVRDLGLTNW